MILLLGAAAIFEDDVLTSALVKAEAELFAHDMTRLDAMFAKHNCRHVYLDAGTNVGVQIRKVLEPARYPLSGAGRSELAGACAAAAMGEASGVTQASLSSSTCSASSQRLPYAQALVAAL